jgi:6-pyruvoyltetrahydropterin/6-carboxytetrahydropterin synthase
VTYTIAKRFDFEASHQLEGLPAWHKCGRLHGHSYQVEVELAADGLDERGFVLDYGDLAPVADFIADRLDHRHLPEVLPIQTSAENLARWLFEQASALVPHVTAVRVRETRKTWAEYRP